MNDNNLNSRLSVAQQKKHWLDEITDNADAVKLLHSYDPVSVEIFLSKYINQKVLWHTQPEKDASKNECAGLKWIDSAFRHFEIILQKKLFDAQCLWRAEMAEYDGVKLCADFIIWQHNIFACPFIEQVTLADITLYTQYLLQPGALAMAAFTGEWLTYDEVKTAYSNPNIKASLPGWYHFHNKYSDTAQLLLLPDIRGQKEWFYWSLYFEGQQLNNVQTGPSLKKREPAWMNPSDAAIRFFVHRFEDSKVKHMYTEYTMANRHGDKLQDVIKMIEELLDADELVPVVSNQNWEEAIQLTLNNYRCKKTIEALPMGLEQYQMNVGMGIAFWCANKGIYDKIRHAGMVSILHGRRLNGEPENLDF